MKKFLVSVVLAAASVSSFAAGFSECSNLFVDKAPISSTIDADQLCYSRMAILYSRVNKAPLAVSERITNLNVTSTYRVTRGNNFRPDPQLPREVQPTAGDFVHNIWDQGHQVPFEDVADSAQAADESFFYTNIVAQQEKHNRGIWRALEMRVRKLAAAKGEIFVVTGPAFVDKNALPSGVRIPSHLWKVVYATATHEAFVIVIPNKEGYRASDIPSFNATFDQLKSYVPYLNFGNTTTWKMSRF